MNDEQYLLANAYVDGELTDDERELAETDQDVMSEVDRLLALRARLRHVDPPSAAAREAAVVAAMTVFPAAAPRPAPPINAAVRTVPVRRRPTLARYLGLAAAVVAVGLLGLVVATGLRSGDDDFATEPASDAAADVFADEPAAEPAAEAPAADRLVESAEAELAEDANDMGDGDDADAIGDVDDSSAASPPMTDATADHSSEQPADESASDSADEPAAESADEGAPLVQPAIDPSQPLDGAVELGAYGAYLLELQESGELPPTPNTDCPQAGLLGQTQYLFDGVPVDVYVVIDDQERTVSAVDPDTCETLVVGPLF